MPAAFFSAPDPEFVPLGAVSFRALSKLTARQRDSATAAGSVAIDLSRWIDSRFRLPEPAVPTLEGYDPERAAAVVRERWGLGLAPIPNLIHVLEAKGIRVFSLASDVASVDAFSFTLNATPYIFLNTSKTGERRRFDAAHELGHLVLHCGDEVPHGKDAEREAHAFAAELLMPRETVLAAGLRNADVAQILRAKQQWRVSAMALAHRLQEVGLVTEWGYRDLCVRLSQLGYRRGEPSGAIVPEASQVLAKVFKTLREQGISPGVVAREIAVSPEELNKHVFGLIPVVLDGSAKGGRPRGASHLQVVRSED